MWGWLNDNSAGVQALAAVVIVVLTAALVSVTGQYVRLTKRIAETTQRQLSATIQPVLSLVVLKEGLLTKLGLPIKFAGRIEIANRGQQPVKVKSISAVVRLRSVKSFEQLAYRISDCDNLVLMPNGPPDVRDFALQTELVWSAPTDVCSLGIYADCTDLAGVSEHSFYYDPDSGLRHFFGFKKVVEPTGLRWKLKRIKAKLDQWVSLRKKSRTSS